LAPAEDIAFQLKSSPSTANAADVQQELQEWRKPLIITRNGEAKAIIQDVVSTKNPGVAQDFGAWQSPDRAESR
jgi:hypothetical protein